MAGNMTANHSGNHTGNAGNMPASLSDRRAWGVLGALFLLAGVFSPVMSMPGVGSFTFMGGGGSGGIIVLALALVSLLVSLYGDRRWLLALALMAAITLIATFFSIADRVEVIQQNLVIKLASTPFKELVDAAAETVQMEWGWAVLIAGVGLLVAAAGAREVFRSEVTARSAFFRRNGLAVSSYLILAVSFWIVVLIILPQAYMVNFSFSYPLPPSKIGGPEDVFTLESYRYLLFGSRGNPDMLNWLHLKVFFRSIVAAMSVTVANLAICYPIAYYIAQVARGGKTRLMIICLILPFWVNEILRAFAFRLLFGNEGILNSVLLGIGVIDQPVDFIRADVALYSGLTYAYILLMIFPLYNAIESLDHNQVDAARDLGSPWWRIHWRVVVPHAKPGIASGCTMVFMLTAGALATPQILGGPSSLWFTQIIYRWFNAGGNWPVGAAYAFVLLAACVVFVLTLMRLFRISLGQIAK